MIHKVLIVEDNKTKKDEIERILGAQYDVLCSAVPTISGAYANLEHESWDLVILDMSFQVSQVGHAVQKEALAGIELLQFMVAKGIHYPVVVATQHTTFTHGFINFGSIDELHASLREAFPSIYRSTVKVDLASSNWHQELLAAVKDTLDVRGNSRAVG